MFKQILSNLFYAFCKILFPVIGFCVWHFTLGHYYPIMGWIVGITTAIFTFFTMIFFERNSLNTEDSSEEELRGLINDIVWNASFNCSKQLYKAYKRCNLSKSIDFEFIHPSTGDKYRLIFRKMRNGERMQAPDLREHMQAKKEIEEELSKIHPFEQPVIYPTESKENIFIETDEDWQPGQYEPEENKTGISPEAKPNEGVHEIAASVFNHP